MKPFINKISLTLSLLALSVPLSSFTDFISYWTVKLNGTLIYDSSKDVKDTKLHLYSVEAKNISLRDTVEVELFTDSPCGNCIYNYFISEFTSDNGEAYEVLGTYLKEQKSLGPKAYKIALMDVYKCGTSGTIKSIFYFKNEQQALELCRINFK